MISLERTKRAGGWALKPKWQTPLPPRVSRKRSGHSICSEADGNSSRSPETLSIELPFQHSRNCHGFRRVTFRIASHDCTTEKSRDGFSEGKAKARRWSDLPGKSLTTEPLRTSTRTHSVHMAGPGKGNATDRDQTQLAAKPVGKTTS